MTLHRRAARRDKNEPSIVKALLADGLQVTRLSVPVDLLVWRSGQPTFVLLEVKTLGGGITEAQIEFFQASIGCPRYVVYEPAEAVVLVNTAIKRGGLCHTAAP